MRRQSLVILIDLNSALNPSIIFAFLKMTIERPLLSVVIPVFNHPKLLDRALHSLVEQNEKNFEVIVVDDGSTDDIKTIVDSYRKSLNLKFIQISNSGGPATPRNVGIEASIADWISLLDADDWWAPNRISYMMKIIKKISSYDVFYHRLSIVSEGRNLQWWSNKSLGFQILGNPFIGLMTMGDGLPNSSVIFRRACYVEYGGFNQSLEYSSVEDYDYWLMLAMNSVKFYFVNKSLGFYWWSSGGISANPKLTIEKNKLILDKYIPYLATECIKKKTQSRFNYFAGSVLLNAGYSQEALGYFLNANFLINGQMKLKRLWKIIIILLRMG